MKLRFRYLAIMALVLGWVNTAAAELPPLIPRAVLFGNPEKASPQISPDGKYLAYIAPDAKDVQQVWVRTIGKDDDRALTDDKKRGIRTYVWTFDGEQLIYLQDSDGDENYHLTAVNLKTGIIRDLTPFQGIRAEIIDLDAKYPKEILVGMNLKNRAKFDVYRINLANGAVEFDTANPGNVMVWTADADFKIRAAIGTTPDGGSDLLYRPAPDAKWEKLRHWDSEEEGSPLSFSKDNKTLYVTANHDANALRLLAIDLDSKKETVLAEDKNYDVRNVMVHPEKRSVQAVFFNKDKVERKILDKSIEADFKVLDKLRKGQLSLVSRDQADKTWLASFSNDDGPTYYYTYDRAKKKGTLLFSHQPKLEGLSLATMKPISLKARDGLVLHGYLTLPVGVPAKNLPTVLLVHGGPWARDSWGYNSTVQWLANRGYAVLQINYRGSTGYGKKFLNAGNKEWAGKMHTDLIDGVNWLVKQGIADPKKIAIMGGSYGGYATLVGLTFTPDVFACGVDIVGPSNLVTLLNTIPPYWAPVKAMFGKRVGDLATEEDMLKDRSPFFFADKIKVPLLIGQGANDPRVKQAESDQIVKAMRKAGKPVEYIIYTDEGHGFVRPENRLHFFARAEAFLARHMGGRAESADTVKGHSAVIK
ncbi:MAG TPA: S9 family peptidase [Gemmataceae bacterium]|nr:S9 family peptidase [Gemmataceae bacterium]